jgi:glycosyltransferase involved in cell wall biosynthesis
LVLTRRTHIVRPLKIIHVMRAPVGGLFRHVADLARAQAARGHAVGIIVDSTTGAQRAEAVLASVAPDLSLGIQRIAMSRHLGLSDLAAARAVGRAAATHSADVIHGHGAKGGAYARLTNGRSAIRIYTPHGGSLHYRPNSPLGLIYLNLERVLMPRTELFLFESAYGQSVFQVRIGTPPVGAARVVHNGVADSEFALVESDADATDLVFIGELRALKGVDVLIEAVALLMKAGRAVTATIVGDGPDAQAFRDLAASRGLIKQIRFVEPLPAREAFARGRTVVVPSRAESLPYIVLEAAAAGCPIIATNVGGIPEIFGPETDKLIEPAEPKSLAAAIETVLANPDLAQADARRLRTRVRAGFSVDAMAEQILAAYADALSRQNGSFLRSN